jgi:histidinol-phosphate aminotransferase
MLSVAHASIRTITPYVPGKAAIVGHDEVIKLSSNEAALGPSPKAIAAYHESANGAIHRYPDGSATPLREALGAVHGMDPARIVCGAGSEELLSLLVHAYAEPGAEVLYSQHGFLMYPAAALRVGAVPVAAPERELCAEVNGLLHAVTPRTRVVLLANPNNPTGTYLPRDALHRLRAGLRDDILLVVDGAYAEYVEAADYDDGRDLVDTAPNTVICRTFSKIHGLAGLRVGWAYCPEHVVDIVHRIRGPFNVSGPAIAAACAALEDPDFCIAQRAHTSYWRKWLVAELAELGLEAPTSVANFQLVGFGSEARADAVYHALQVRGIIVRQMQAYLLPAYLRVTIGTEKEMRAFVKALISSLERVCFK